MKDKRCLAALYAPRVLITELWLTQTNGTALDIDMFPRYAVNEMTKL